MPLKGAAVTRKMAELTLDREVQMYEKRLEPEIRRKVAESVVAAEISDRLNAFSNISSRGTAINFYLPIFISPSLIPHSLKIYPALLLQPQKNRLLTHCSRPDFFLCASAERTARELYLGDGITETV